MIISYAPPHMLYMMIWYPEGKKEKKKNSELGVPGDTSRMHTRVRHTHTQQCAKRVLQRMRKKIIISIRWTPGLQKGEGMRIRAVFG